MKFVLMPKDQRRKGRYIFLAPTETCIINDYKEIKKQLRLEEVSEICYGSRDYIEEQIKQSFDICRTDTVLIGKVTVVAMRTMRYISRQPITYLPRH